jgi:phosphoglucomutase/phosphomannomutase
MAGIGIERTAQQAREGFVAITADAALVERALANLTNWLTAPVYEPQLGPIAALIGAGAWPLLLDSFHQLIPFGTGGRRGRVGYGPNRINEIVVAMSVQGHCNYLREREVGATGGTIVVAFDTRVFKDLSGTYRGLGEGHPVLGTTSRSLARAACEIYAANGFDVFVPGLADGSRFLSTPELSFAIRHLCASGGINVSASHNHPDDNGFKFFSAQGSQDVPPQDDVLASYMAEVADIRRTPFDGAVSAGKVRDLPASVHAAYLSTNLALATAPARKGFKVVYTPLCGTGGSTVGEVVAAAGYGLVPFAPQSDFDGTFASVPMRLPNPEFPLTGQPAVDHAESIGATLVLSTDPDADRIGVYGRRPDGSWRYFTGNDAASALAHYLIADPRGPRRRGLVIKTLVTTGAIEAIARAHGCTVVGDLLVGFKFIAGILNDLDATGRFRDLAGASTDLVIACEESHGLLLTPAIRDKDAAGAGLLLCELAARLDAEGLCLADYVDEVHLAFGNHANAARNLVMRGIQGSETLGRIMMALRSAPPAEVGGLPVIEVRDMLDARHGPLRSETERHARNVLVLRLDGAQLTIRPSGTEPKLKIYVEVVGARLGAGTRKEASAAADRIGAAALDATLACAGITLPPSGRLLPDHIEVGMKAGFDRALEDLFASAPAGLAAEARDRVLGWLRAGLAPYGGGADPLESVRAGVAHWCSSRAGAASPGNDLPAAVLRAL